MPVNDSEPRYQLVETDAQGNVTDVLSSVYAEADGTLKLQEGSGSNNEAALQPDGTLDVPKVSTDKADITNETLVRATMSADQNLTSGIFATVAFDTAAKDERNEFDTTNNQFTPDETGWYWVAIAVGINAGNPGDQLDVNFRDADAGTNLQVYQIEAPEPALTSCLIVGLVELTGGNAHEVIARDNDSSSIVSGSDGTTNLSIRRAWR